MRWRRSATGTATRARSLLAVPLDGVRVADPRAVGILRELAVGAALAKEVPAPVERHLDLCDARPLFLGRPLLGVTLAQPLLLVDERGDPVQDVGVVHDLALPLVAVDHTVASRDARRSIAARVAGRAVDDDGAQELGGQVELGEGAGVVGAGEGGDEGGEGAAEGLGGVAG